MAITYDDFKNVRPNPAVVAAAAKMLKAADAIKRDPRYAETVNRFGPERASWLAAHYGGQALSDSFQRNVPIDMDLSKQAVARLDVFNWAASHMPGSSSADVQKRADGIWDGLSAIDKAKLAEAPGNTSTIIADAIKGTPFAAGAARHADSTNGGADSSAGGGSFFARNAFGQTPWEQRSGAAGYGGTIRNSSVYNSLSGSWNSSMGGAGLNNTNFGGTPFAAAGLNLGVTQSLFAQGYNQANILSAANNAAVLGLDHNNKIAMEHMAGIDKYDPDKKLTIDLAKKYKDELDHDDDYQGLRQQLNDAPPEKRKDILEKMKTKEREHADQSGWRKHVDQSPNARVHHYRQGVDDDINKTMRDVGHLRKEIHHGDEARDASTSKLKAAAPGNAIVAAAPSKVIPPAGGAQAKIGAQTLKNLGLS